MVELCSTGDLESLNKILPCRCKALSILTLKTIKD